MAKKYVGIAISLMLLLTPVFFSFAQAQNTGFISGNIWYSKDPFEEGDKIKIYTLIYNPDPKQLSGTVFFFDKTTFLGNKTFTVPGKGMEDVSLDWTVDAGDHVIFGQIQNAKFLLANNTYEDASLSETKTTESKRSVSKKIISNVISNTASTANTTSTNNTVSNIEKIIKQNTPEVVSKTIDSTVSSVDGFRENIGTLSENKKAEIKKDIQALENTTNPIVTKKDSTKKISQSTPAPSNQSMFLKPFKYVELFGISLFSFIFNNKYVFYGLSALIIFFILRFIIRKIF